jgi:hypothetical protein
VQKPASSNKCPRCGENTVYQCDSGLRCSLGSCQWSEDPKHDKLIGTLTALDTQVGGDHYKSMAIQPIEFCVRNDIGFAEGLAIKYIVRHGQKNGAEDLDKAIHCLQILRELKYGKPT